MIPTKVCRYCLKEFPLTRFEPKKTNPGGRSHKCRNCRKPQIDAAKKKWVQNNRERVAAYAKNYMLTYKKKRLRNPETAERFRRRLEAKLALLEARQGPEYAAIVRRICETNGTLSHHHRPIIRELLPPHLKNIGANRMQRLIEVNNAAGKPHWNIGWSCALCGEQNDDHRFFDVDHVIPKAKGGDNSRANLQVICPSCHRKKTIADGVLSVPAPSELGDSVPNRADSHSIINNPTADNSALCGGPVEPSPLLRTALGS